MNSEHPDFLWLDDHIVAEELRPPDSGSRSAIPGLPAEPGLWLFVLGDMTVFGWFFIVYMWERRADHALFVRSAAELHPSIGVVNTFVLLTSSLFVVVASRNHRLGRSASAIRMLRGAGLCAVAFVAIKAIEYSVELSGGHSPGQNTLFLFYFALTGIHLLHVMIGAGLLWLWARAERRGRDRDDTRILVEGAAVYWHMVDLLWILIFTLVYLVGSA